MGQWILNSASFQVAKKGIIKKIRSGKRSDDFSFSTIIVSLHEEWNIELGVQLKGALGTMHWKAIPSKEEGVYELVLWDNFDFEAAKRMLLFEALTSLGRFADFTPFRTELRIKLETRAELLSD